MSHGDLASLVAVEIVSSWAWSLRRLTNVFELTKLFDRIHAELKRRLRGVGDVTLTLAVVDLEGGGLVAASIGDSIAYRVSVQGGVSHLVETDASGGHVTSRALGVRLHRVHHAKTDLGGCDLVVLATDGVADVIGEELLRTSAWKAGACSTE